jgi:hypothetical protein
VPVAVRKEIARMAIDCIREEEERRRPPEEAYRSFPAFAKEPKK